MSIPKLKSSYSLLDRRISLLVVNPETMEKGVAKTPGDGKNFRHVNRSGASISTKK
ncbi:hypothetical protein ACE1B6_03380 [Aerosakkonemataceae cyanobacterium BLCC-F154]|uniref:Ribosomal protein L32 n=1 Tax=Floridaenema fluviatile BLCC-F154 TaxID=3153640 RepID=A0ABV4Y665_9CYAN